MEVQRLEEEEEEEEGIMFILFTSLTHWGLKHKSGAESHRRTI